MDTRGNFSTRKGTRGNLGGTWKPVTPGTGFHGCLFGTTFPRVPFQMPNASEVEWYNANGGRTSRRDPGTCGHPWKPFSSGTGSQGEPRECGGKSERGRLFFLSREAHCEGHPWKHLKTVSTGAHSDAKVSTGARFPRVPSVERFPRVPCRAPVETNHPEGHPWKPAPRFPRLPFSRKAGKRFPRVPFSGQNT